MGGVYNGRRLSFTDCFLRSYSYDHNYDVINSLGYPRIAFIKTATLE